MLPTQQFEQSIAESSYVPPGVIEQNNAHELVGSPFDGVYLSLQRVDNLVKLIKCQGTKGQ